MTFEKSTKYIDHLTKNKDNRQLMAYLFLVSLIWALSFGLIKTTLSAIDPVVIGFIRLALSLLLFCPFLKLKAIPARFHFRLILIGAIQYGLMYIFYLWSFRILLAYEVALFTALTPIYITLFDDWLSRKISPRFLFTAALAVLGTAIAIWNQPFSAQLLNGFLLVQLSNLCFAAGQILYRRAMAPLKSVRDEEAFGLLYLGASFVTLIAVGNTPNISSLCLDWKKIAVLLYLGVIASGLCFFLWNYAARKVNTGALAIMNNLKIPLAVLCSILFFGEKADWLKLGLGFLLIAGALILNEKWRSGPSRNSAARPRQPAP